MKKSKKKLNVKKVFLFLIIIVAIIVVISKLNNKEENEISDETNAKNSEEEQIVESENNTQDTLLEAINNNNGEILGDSGLPVLMYHFFYDENERTGQDGNWIEISKFEEQMKYLNENNYYYPTWQEVEDYIDGVKNLPKKSVVITVDDGDDSFFELAVPILQKYNVNATSFVITSWYGARASNKELNVDYQSHSDGMHKAGANGKGVMLSWDYDKIKNDVVTSSEVLGGANIFCYPFGQYNEDDIKVLKDAGYKLAFTTKAGRVKKGASKYELPRVRISADTSLNSFISKIE